MRYDLVEFVFGIGGGLLRTAKCRHFSQIVSGQIFCIKRGFAPVLKSSQLLGLVGVEATKRINRLGAVGADGIIFDY
ncbi:MAG: hypothetical protein WBW41_02760 [Verrucomicrobiia bacterium]